MPVAMYLYSACYPTPILGLALWPALANAMLTSVTQAKAWKVPEFPLVLLPCHRQENMSVLAWWRVRDTQNRIKSPQSPQQRQSRSVNTQPIPAHISKSNQDQKICLTEPKSAKFLFTQKSAHLPDAPVINVCFCVVCGGLLCSSIVWN